jgi:hypothetical protein
MRPIIQGAKLGLSECRWQFRHHHWNCSVLPLKSPETTLPPTTIPTSTTTMPPQSRVLRENNKNANRKRKARNHRNGTDNLNLGKDFYAAESSPKSRRKNRKNNPLLLEDGMSTNNFVMDGMTTSTSWPQRAQTEQVQDPQPLLHLHHHDKEEKANWDSILTRGDHL